MKNRFITILVTLFMVFTLLPHSVMATETYNIWVGGVQVTSENAANVLDGINDGKVSYNPATQTLTLNGAHISTALTDSFWGDTFSIHSQEPTLTLTLIGENKIEGVDSIRSTYGVRCEGELTIAGEGSLTITPGQAYKDGASGNNHSSGILTEGGLTLNNVTLDIKGERYGLYEYRDGYITINGGTVTAYGSSSAFVGNLKTNGQIESVMAGDGNPGTEWDGSTYLSGTYKYVKIILTNDVAQIGSQSYKDLQLAINAFTDGDTIKLVADIIGCFSTDGNDKSFTLDLNGKTLDGGNDSAIQYLDSGTLSILDSSTEKNGKVINNSGVDGTVYLSTGSLIINEGTVENTGGFSAIANYGNGSITISVGTVENTNGPWAIYNSGSGNINISGGIVSSSDEGSTAIHNEGGDIIFPISSTSGSPIVKGAGQALNKAFLLGNSPVKITASTNYDGSTPELYNEANIDTYKYLKFDYVDTYPISGTVKDSATNSGISGATVQIKDATHTPIALMISDENGFYAFAAVPAGNYYIETSATGYDNSKTDSFDLNANLADQELILTKTAAPLAHTITATAGTGGTITPNGNVSVDNNGLQLFKISPSSNYSIADVLIDGVSQGKISSYSFDHVTANHTISAIFNYNGSSGGGSSGSSGSGSSTTNNNDKPKPPAPPTPNESKEPIVEKKPQNIISFIDINSHWAEQDIEFTASLGLFSGTSNSIFSPDTAMTRGMFVTVLGRLANANVSGYTTSSFSDVESPDYYSPYIEWAAANHIARGIGNEKFAPEQPITREQLAVFIQKYSQVKGISLPIINSENQFADSEKISPYARDAVRQMQIAGILIGKNDNLFAPQEIATRAEVSSVLHRFLNLLKTSNTR